MSNLIFWLIGGSISLFFFRYLETSHIPDALIPFSITLLVTNGLLNSLIADILVTYIPFNRWIKKSQSHHYTIYIYQILFHLVTTAVAIPFLINVGLHTLNVFEEMQFSSKQIATANAKSIEDELDKWSEKDIQRLNLNGLIQIGYLKELITLYTSKNSFEIIMTDSENKVLATSIQSFSFKNEFSLKKNNSFHSTTEDFYKSIPNENLNNSYLLNWATGFLVFEKENTSTNINIYILFPIYDYQQQIFNGIFQQYRFILLFAAGSFILAIAINQLLVQTLSKLSQTTTGLPRKIEMMEPIYWPTSFIYELKTLIDNFKHMSLKLKNMFHEIQTMNRKLEDQARLLKKSEEKLYNLAYYDQLTNLPNRLHFHQYLSNLLAKNVKRNKIIAVLFLDLNRFKQVNDTLGHEAGDMLLKVISSRLQSLTNHNTMVFRLGGDEFVLVNDSIDKQSVAVEANRLLSIFNDPVKIDNVTLYISGSVGVSVYPEDGEDIDTLVKNADMAMYNSKEEGGKHASFFKKQMEKSFSEKMILDHSLHEAIRENQFELYYQPKIDSNTEELSGMEALIRWQHPEYGIISPSTFIPIAEELGLIFEIDKWCIFQACKQNKAWHNKGYPDMPVSVNLSAKCLYEPDLISILKSSLEATGLDAKYLKLEITEGVFIRDPDLVIDKIKKINQLGIAISIDDFGMGYSSLYHLLHLPIQEIKIDKIFVQDINKDEKQGAIVNMIISLAHRLRLNVVAEGIETKEEVNRLRQYQCNEFQGYYYSKPLNHKEFTQYLINTDKK
ncbi:putative bifunctional diguanylate cyclase/phosphodiesterase [Metabacillus halosaccharovorans]|uniref:EAL domain-containing protein n=1 Tax=Metabacillus halosaccharovorans TaxID=930124 RepID=A0ABT3DNP6_9BACI|nr:EAL domain-containing protein [Metabacillus halosaccharovorans]MCV9888689.1 EAL domain-containing protein [Metabacillus halosaccharovorans]